MLTGVDWHHIFSTFLPFLSVLTHRSLQTSICGGILSSRHRVPQ